jgi:uncharacterized damage-inducible protein DinB
MTAKWRWVDRTFTFDFPVGKYPDIVERYRGTPARLDEWVARTPPEHLTRQDPAGGWTILQNIGHLLDLEPLWERRLDDYLAGRGQLSAADMSNRATHEAGHNQRNPRELLAAFRAARMSIVSRLDGLVEADWSRVAVHPRLKQPMRLVDAIAFTCDHDDYHLARIAALARLFRGSAAPAGGTGATR